MGLFDRFKKKRDVCWRNSKGEIYCPGDSRPQQCDTTCPIWCQTLALQQINAGSINKAIDYFKQAVTVAPDFKDAWVNMASLYGQTNNHLEANRAFLKAYSIDNNYENAIRGLIASYKNLGQFDEAFKYCDIYERNIGNRVEAENLRNTVRDLQVKGDTVSRDSDMKMALELVDMGRKLGILGGNDKMPTIPELLCERQRTCQGVLNELVILAKQGHRIIPQTICLWGIFAGIGAVHFWNESWAKLKEKGILEALLEPRGAFAMDEYVLDVIGTGFDTEQGKNLTSRLTVIVMLFLSEHQGLIIDGKLTREDALEIMQAMFLFGMVFQMERLGLK